MRSSNAGCFVLGVFVGALGALVAVRLKKAVESGEVEDLSEKIQDSLGELESRLEKLLDPA